MMKHNLEGGALCQREENEYGVAYDPDCPECRAEEAAEPVTKQEAARPIDAPSRRH